MLAYTCAPDGKATKTATAEDGQEVSQDNPHGEPAMTKLTLKPIAMAVGLALCLPAMAQKLDFSGSNIYMSSWTGTAAAWTPTPPTVPATPRTTRTTASGPSSNCA